MAAKPTQPTDSRITLSNVLELMERHLDLFQPAEQQNIRRGRQYLQQGQMPPREVLAVLGAAYQRVKASQEQLLHQAEEGAVYLVGTEIEALHMARAMLDAGRLLTGPQLQMLRLAHVKSMLPQILESLENMAMLLNDDEQQLVHHARAVLDIGGGQVDNTTLQKLVMLMNSLQNRQYTG